MYGFYQIANRDFYGILRGPLGFLCNFIMNSKGLMLNSLFFFGNSLGLWISLDVCVNSEDFYI